MSPERYERELGSIGESLRQLQDGQETLFGKLDTIRDEMYARIDSLKNTGCAVGAVQAVAIAQIKADVQELKDKPSKVLAATSALAGIASTAAAFFSWIAFGKH